jgi:hypothetical protein
MSPPPRSLTFAVSTSLLTVSLSLAGCDEPKQQVNPGPVNEKPEPEGDHVNVGPEPDTKEVNPGPEPEVAPEPIHVNEGPQPQPEPPPEQPLKVNPGPDDPKPTLEVVEPKHVNTRPDSP